MLATKKEPKKMVLLFMSLKFKAVLKLFKVNQQAVITPLLKKAYIPTTFDQVMCQSFVGKEIEGTIVKEECENYLYVVKETGEELILNHRWVFTPEKKEAVLQKQDNSDALLMNLNAFSNLYPKHAEFAS